MAAYVFHLPDLGEGLAEGTVVEWLVVEGAELAQGDPLAEIETTKAVVEVPAPVSGTVTKLHATAGETLAVGDPLVTFETSQQAGIVGTVPAEERPTRSVRLRPPS